MRWHRLAAVLLIALLSLGRAAPAGAGGSTWQFDAQRYRPGDTAFAWAPVAWEHSTTLGTPEDGPYAAWLVPLTDPPSWEWPDVPDASLRVADVVVSLEPYVLGGTRFGPHHATVEFTVPDLPAGRYELVHCNTPCTTTLGDITFGELTVVAGPQPPPQPPATTILAAAAPLVADGNGDGPPPWLLAFIGASAVGTVAFALFWLLRDRVPRQPTVKPT